MQEKLSLLMCQTPLQALIAEKIIEINKDKKFYPIYTAYDWNDKHEHYSSRLIKLCQRGIKKEIRNVKEIANFQEEIKVDDFNEIYLASIDAPLNLALLSRKELDVYTYDDGSANVTPKSFYFRKSKNPMTFPELNITWNMDKVKEISKKHYTIFSSDFNIVAKDRLEKIELFEFDEKQGGSGEVSILIGQMILPPGQNEALMQKVMAENKIDYFFPHPREGLLESLKDKTIITELIFEEYYLELLKKYAKVHIYHFYSTVALNIRNHPRIEEHIIDKNYYESWYFTI